jgi:hypothetical protein
MIDVAALLQEYNCLLNHYNPLAKFYKIFPELAINSIFQSLSDYV